ncbi:iron chelate uptake ABC transporter family permease subunit [Acinetobacter rudis]|uniref:Iron chelate uptake ABC transporter family permease subunit n=1 Tax=Acinetobacter rudis TaxID=632955 RepID=A0AAW8J5F8_9GAMM|nr:iron chelate uptake ABC transporter family permease subunit [Acinetobacter rudis]MDQ8935337.1 iron chelate uptake ABC transporter family permease subunit [Acinetobacter rudis]MDQ9017600.1 iron chelate uptake ABC transporter family permease subunit [Acinetobacter rudis]
MNLNITFQTLQQSKKHLCARYIGISTLVVGLALFFVFFNADMDFDYVIPRRLLRLATIVLAGICIAFSAIIFQTLMGNRILTPAVMGYEAIYLLWQVLLLFLFGTQTLFWLGLNGHFFLSIFLMLLYSWAIQHWLLPHVKQNVFQLLLCGLVLSLLFGTITQFVQLKISPGEFSIFQGLSYASFNRSQPETLLYASLAVAALAYWGRHTFSLLDVLLLGAEQAQSLGLDHDKLMRRCLAIIAILVAISTSLIGPTAFMGIFIANITYALAGRFQHYWTLLMGSLLAITVFLLAQILVEHIFNYKTTISILINLVCGVYFLLLALRTRGMT